jgi:hypothetical protein
MLMDGVVETMFDEAMQDVLANISDPNTKSDAVRTITFTVTVKPNEKRTDAALNIECKTSLAKLRPVSTMLLLGQSDGQPAAVEAFRNEELFGDPHGRPHGVVEGGVR